MTKSETKSIKSLIKESVRKPSFRFGSLVMEVDHQFIGEKMKAYRLVKQVRAIDVADSLKISKTLVNFLESGRRLWSLEMLKAYLRAVKAAERNGRSERAKTKK